MEDIRREAPATPHSARPTLRIRRVPVRALSPAAIDRMWELYEAHYDHVERRAFDRDLAEKTLVFVGTDAATGATVGFSTALFFSHGHGGRTAGVYFSGDTVVDPRYWGQTALHRAIAAEMALWTLRHPSVPLYWYLLCSGYRTYLALARNFPAHWPRDAEPTPVWERGFVDSIGRTRYGASWQAERGIVSFGDVQPVLKAGIAPLTPELRALPEVAFFTSANPGWARGDELAVLARVDLRALARMAAKWLRKALGRPGAAAAPPRQR